MLYKRTHTCGELTSEHVGKSVVLNGWVDARRDFGGLAFIDLRDRYGITQVVFEPEAGQDLQAQAHELRNEYVVGVKGTVAPRLPGKENPEAQDRGDRGAGPRAGRVQRDADAPLRDARARAQRRASPDVSLPRPARPGMQQIFILRHRLTQLMRRTMSDLGFLEVETPILGRSTPEGAATSWSPAGSMPGISTHCPNRPSCTSSF